MTTLGWLHFTDLHIGQPKDGGRLGTIESALLEDLAAEAEREKMPFDVVFFTGDNGDAQGSRRRHGCSPASRPTTNRPWRSASAIVCPASRTSERPASTAIPTRPAFFAAATVAGPMDGRSARIS